MTCSPSISNLEREKSFHWRSLPTDAQRCSFIREKLAEKYGNEAASYAIILYGGSVKPDNTYSILKENNINGALVGGASLEADSFIQITKEAIKAYKEKK